MGFFMRGMKMKLLQLFLLGSVLGCTLSVGIAQADDAVQLAKASDDELSVSEPYLGVVYPNQERVVSVTIRNDGDEIKRIRVSPRNSIDKVLAESAVTIGAKREVTLKIAIQTDFQAGNLARYFDVYEADGSLDDDPVESFAVRGFVDWIVDPASVDVDFGNVDVGKGSKRVVTIKTRAGIEMQLKNVLKESSRFSLKILGPEQIELSVKPDAPLGLFDEYLILSTSDPNQTALGIRVRGQFFSGLLPSSNPVDFGLARVGDAPEQLVQLENLYGDAVRIGPIRTEGVAATAELQECIPQNESCKILKLKLSELETRGLNKGKVFLELLPSKKIMPIHFGAVVIGRDTQIRNLDDDMKAAASIEPSVTSLLRNATQAPVKPLEMSKPAGSGPLLTWQAAHEYGVYGYEVYRAESKEGQFRRVSPGIIPRLDKSSKKGSIYRWRDADYQSGKTYWYYVNVVMESGSKREFTTPQKVVAK